MATVGPKCLTTWVQPSPFLPKVRHQVVRHPKLKKITSPVKMSAIYGIWRRLDQNASPLGSNLRHFSPRGEASFKIILSWNRLGVMMAPQVIHLEICSVGRYSPTKLRNPGFLLAGSTGISLSWPIGDEPRFFRLVSYWSRK